MNPIVGALSFLSRQVGVVRIGARLVASAVRGWREGSGNDEKMPDGAWTYQDSAHVGRQIESAARPYTPEEKRAIETKQAQDRARREQPTARPPKKPPK